jgi:hypothetical protein
MLSRKALRELKKAEKRRARRPVPKVMAPQSLSAPGNVERRMMNSYQSVLQNIEFALVSAYRDHESVDDAVVAQTLRAAILRTSPDDPAVRIALAVLNGIRDMRSDVPDEVWIDGLRVVYNSVGRHSRCRHGETDYLDFVAEFLP